MSPEGEYNVLSPSNWTRGFYDFILDRDRACQSLGGFNDVVFLTTLILIF